MNKEKLTYKLSDAFNIVAARTPYEKYGAVSFELRQGEFDVFQFLYNSFQEKRREPGFNLGDMMQSFASNSKDIESARGGLVFTFFTMYGKYARIYVDKKESYVLVTFKDKRKLEH
ncbi:hypothetical protein [Pleionea sediminis]|uniref:hypothetical protein n=1 Tax=Pleionea sediminis TaxID=2569479 RepID=UPI001186B704|nr:hypothetical protein [Pleionea sediminis]